MENTPSQIDQHDDLTHEIERHLDEFARELSATRRYGNGQQTDVKTALRIRMVAQRLSEAAEKLFSTARPAADEPRNGECAMNNLVVATLTAPIGQVHCDSDQRFYIEIPDASSWLQPIQEAARVLNSQLRKGEPILGKDGEPVTFGQGTPEDDLAALGRVMSERTGNRVRILPVPRRVAEAN